MNSPLRTLKQRTKRAFTLIETVISIGIVSTVLVALIGLMPEGMNMISQAGQRTVGARIAQQLIGQIQLADFDEVPSFDDNYYYFDDQGTEVDQDAVERIYTAKIEVATTNPSVDGSNESELLYSVVIKVSDRPGDPDFSETEAGRQYLRYSTVVVNLDDEIE